MMEKRIIACLDMKEGRVVKGIRFVKFRDVGDPVEHAKAYERQGADELGFLDITASYEKRKTAIEIVEKVAKEISIPLSVGGGIRTVNEVRNLLNAGAEKVSIGTYAVRNPELIRMVSERFGSKKTVLSIDAKRTNGSWEIYIDGGRTKTGIDALEFAKKAERLGAGEILLNSIDRDGTRKGYDLELNRIFSENLRIPVIASGGAGSLKDILDVLTKGKTDAALLASVLHFGKFTIGDVKEYLKKNGVVVRC
ncbi:MAG: imidazole glycerol phosphate synthase subunit HisF [Candidatus Aenigmarchaeota archaeon]